jgi:methyl-accepting chemotaxis protein
MKLINDTPIRWKLVLVTLLTSMIALLFAGAVMMMYEFDVYKDRKFREATAQADILAASLSASLSFHDVKAAQEYLAALKANPDIASTAVYGADRTLFASYRRASDSQQLPAAAPPLGQEYGDGALSVAVPVSDPSGVVGTVFMEVRAQTLADWLFRYTGIMLLAVIGSFIVTVPVAMWLNASISKPIREIAAAASRVDAGDLTPRVTQEPRADEIGVLVSSFAQMVDGLREMTGEIGSGTGVLAAAANRILATTSTVSAGSAETATAISQTTATMEEVKQTVQLSTDNAQLVSEQAQRTAEVAQSGREAVEAVAHGMQRIREQVETVASTILRLSERGQAIGEIIAAVNDLADQSNLLAVNAAIEAARAGEQGRGFAVVATEVKSLAEQSKQATAQVRSILEEIQKATGAAVLATEQGTKAVDAGMRESAQAGESIRVLTESIGMAAKAAMQIAASSRQQLTGVSQVAYAMENIRQASIQNAAGVKQTEEAARDVSQLGQKLQTLVQKYRT